jgi:hypothetical protein
LRSANIGFASRDKKSFQFSSLKAILENDTYGSSALSKAPVWFFRGRGVMWSHPALENLQLPEDSAIRDDRAVSDAVTRVWALGGHAA